MAKTIKKKAVMTKQSPPSGTYYLVMYNNFKDGRYFTDYESAKKFKDMLESATDDTSDPVPAVEQNEKPAVNTETKQTGSKPETKDDSNNDQVSIFDMLEPAESTIIRPGEFSL